MAIFDELMENLSDILKRDIIPDPNNVINLVIDQTIKVQIEPDSFDEYIYIAAMIEELPPGKFREHILRDALKANYLADINPGTLSYMYKNNMLMLHQKFPLGSLDALKLIDLVKTLVERAKVWKTAINEGYSAPKEEVPTDDTHAKGSIFGM